ncbi:tetratricopeptide repeat protein [Ferruginibacter yonginensis]|uniref:Tetratricopeptide repeat protein n=1 Tax=Ferruginibacter yonginensis TaxID=1310416 RepID=A0ABV8QV35_9BACT
MILIYSGTAIAQPNKLDALKIALSKTSQPKATVSITNKIVYELRISNPDSAIKLGEPNVLKAHQINYLYGESLANLCLALAHNKKANYKLSEDYCKKAMAIAQQLQNDSLMAASLLNFATIDENYGAFDSAFNKLYAAIKKYETIKNQDGINKAKLVMAQIYQQKNDLKNAEKILNEILSTPKIDKNIEVSSLHTLANMYGMQGNYAKALAIDDKALAICDSFNIIFFKSSVYDNMANCYMYSGDAAKAKIYFQKCITIDSSFGNKKQMSDTYLNLGSLYEMNKQPTIAIQYLKTSIAYANESGYKQGEYAAYLSLSNIYKQLNKTDSALDAMQKGYSIKDKIINESSENKIIELDKLYQFEKKEQQLKLQKSELSKKNYLITTLSIACLLIISTGIFWYRRRRLQNKLALQQQIVAQQAIATKAIIEAEENERKRIAAELHDGIGQMMSAAKMNLSVLENEINFKNTTTQHTFNNIISLVDDSCAEIRKVSHQMMPNALLKFGLTKAIKEFINRLDDSIIKVSIHAEGLNERLPTNIETVLYRVIQESVNNTLKHAAANRLDISIIKTSDEISVLIEDDGKGFNVQQISNAEGIGIKNMLSRVNYLKGTIDFASEPNKGTLVAIHIPL